MIHKIITIAIILSCHTLPIQSSLLSSRRNKQVYSSRHCQLQKASLSKTAITRTANVHLSSSSSSSSESKEYESNLVPYMEDGGLEGKDEVPSMEEIRASLGPIGRTVAGGVEVGIVTAGSYISGGVLGYGIGGLFGIKNLFIQSPSAEQSIRRGVGDEIKRRIGDWNGNAVKQAGQWAKISASFSGFHALSRVVRGGKEDKWNGICGSFATGAFMNRNLGSRAMLQAGASYAGITFMIDVFFGGSTSNQSQHGGNDNGEFGFTDAPVEEEEF